MEAIATIALAYLAAAVAFVLAWQLRGTGAGCVHAIIGFAFLINAIIWSIK